MQTGEHYDADVLFFFDGRPLELGLYRTFFDELCRRFPDASVKVQKSQISFSNRHLFAAASLPVRRKKGWPEHCLMVTFGLGHRENHSRITVATEPYPNRWTHHVLVSERREIDTQLMDWLVQSWVFAENKR